MFAFKVFEFGFS